MSIQAINLKSNWLVKNFKALDLYKFSVLFYDLIKEDEILAKMNPKLKDIMCLDAAYCLFYNKNWLKTSMFHSIAASFLAVEYNIAFKTAIYIVGEMSRSLEGVLNIRSLELKDSDFLKYIFISTVSQDDPYFSEKLGLGKEIFKKLKNVANSLGDKNSDRFEFLPEIDSMYSDIIFDLSKELADKPWIFSAYELQFLLLDAPVPWNTLISEKSSGWLLVFLSETFVNEDLNEKDFISFIEKTFPIFDSSQYSELCHDFLEYLENKNMIYFENTKKKSIARSIKLADLGNKQVSQYVYHHHLSKGSSDYDSFLKLNGYLQSQVLEKCDNIDQTLLLQDLGVAGRVKSEAMTAAVGYLTKFYPKESLIESLEKIVMEGQTPWVRVEACKAISLIEKGQSLKNRLLNISSAANNIDVQTTAMKILINSNEIGIEN